MIWPCKLHRPGFFREKTNVWTTNWQGSSGDSTQLQAQNQLVIDCKKNLEFIWYRIWAAYLLFIFIFYLNECSHWSHQIEEKFSEAFSAVTNTNDYLICSWNNIWSQQFYQKLPFSRRNATIFSNLPGELVAGGEVKWDENDSKHLENFK